MKTIVFDFNGTIIDDVDISLKCLNILRRKYLKLEELSKDEYRNIFTFPIIDYYRRAGFDFNEYSFETIGQEWVDLYNISVKEIGLAEGVIEFLDKYKNKYQYIILSASKKEMIIDQLKQYQIQNYFKDVLGIDNIYAHSKLDIALDYFKDKNLNDYCMIGDTLHDDEVASKIGIDIKLVSNGHQSLSVLKKTGSPIYNSIKEITI